MTQQEILDAYRFRHACKEFDSERTIPAEQFDFLLETIRLSPSSFGLEPWKFLVVQDPVAREKLREHTWGGQKQIPTASHFIVALAKKGYFMRYDAAYVGDFMARIQKLPDDMREKKLGVYENFQRDDFRLLESERALFDWAAKQTYIALGNVMTAAAMIGIDSCPIEGFHKERIEGVLERELGVDLGRYGIAWMAAFGYRKGPPARPKSRQEIEAVVEWR